MASTETLRASLLSSSGAQTLRSLIEDLARQWTSNVHACDDSSVVFEALQDIATSAITTVAREWNSSHDRLRALPAEVQEQCFGSLPVPDRCRLSMICSHWSRNVANLPGIWTRLELGDWYRAPAPDALLARSGQLPLDVTVKSNCYRREWDNALRSHATRLRKLEIYDGLDEFRFPAPQLEELSITREAHSRSTISHMLFDRHAPRLRTLYLTSLPMPLQCPAFRSVTALTLQRTSGRLDNLFGQMPHLNTLSISNHSGTIGLPPLSRRSSLRSLYLVNVRVTVEELVQLGYSNIDDLIVATSAIDTSQFADALDRWPAVATTLRMCANWDFEIVLCPTGRRLAFAVRPCYYTAFERLFSQRRQIQRLVLPISFTEGPYDDDYPSDSQILIRNDSVIVLPELRTLAIECSNIRAPVDVYPLLDCVLGAFEVPRLARIEVLRAAEAPRDAPIETVDAADLVALLDTVLMCDDPDSLEVFVDTASGISLVGDVDGLRNCVGRLIM